MIYTSFQDLKLSTLGLGNMRLPVHSDQEGRPIDYDKAREIIDAAMAGGVNYYDTAYVYHGGESEVFLGQELVARYPRESFFIADKFPYFNDKDYKKVFAKQLERLGTDYIDFYLIHSVEDDTADAILSSGAIEYFHSLKEKGVIRYLGFSCHAGAEKTAQFASAYDWDFAQLQINYFDWAYRIAHAQYDAIRSRHIPLMVMEPVRGGRLATLSSDAVDILHASHPDWTMPRWAFDFVRSLDGVKVILSGMSTLEQVKENVEIFSRNEVLSSSDEAVLFRAAKAFKEQFAVPCTACRYCCDSCPAEINIPEILTIYNRYKTDGRNSAVNSLKEVDSKGKPADCLSCGICTSLCPQKIDVKRYMKELSAL